MRFLLGTALLSGCLLSCAPRSAAAGSPSGLVTDDPAFGRKKFPDTYTFSTPESSPWEAYGPLCTSQFKMYVSESGLDWALGFAPDPAEAKILADGYDGFRRCLAASGLEKCRQRFTPAVAQAVCRARWRQFQTLEKRSRSSPSVDARLCRERWPDVRSLLHDFGSEWSWDQLARHSAVDSVTDFSYGFDLLWGHLAYVKKSEAVCDELRTVPLFIWETTTSRGNCRLFYHLAKMQEASFSGGDGRPHCLRWLEALSDTQPITQDAEGLCDALSNAYRIGNVGLAVKILKEGLFSTARFDRNQMGIENLLYSALSFDEGRCLAIPDPLKKNQCERQARFARAIRSGSAPSAFDQEQSDLLGRFCRCR